MVIRRVGPLSCAKIMGTLNAVIGLIFGAIISLIAIAGGFAANQDGAGMIGAMIGTGSIIILPIVYGCMGFITTLIAAALYNVLAGAVGGVEVDLQ
jgi:hypothetical protein